MTNVFFENTGLPDIIELKNISQKYQDSDKYIIKDLNLLIEDKPNQGQFVVLLGRSGCGKSTLLRYISGLQTPTSGEVLIFSKPRTKDICIPMVFQQYSSLPWLTVFENIELGLRFSKASKKERLEKTKEMISLVGLEGHENKYAKYPLLSGGQLQRIAIARSLVANPTILLMDEPFGALDINTRLHMQDMVRNIWKRLNDTIIFVTHDIAEAVYLADEIHILSTNPAQIVERIIVNLPFDRSREIKRDRRFIDLVYEIEDKMVSIEQQSGGK